MKLLQKIVLGILLFLFVTALTLFGSILFDGITGKDRLNSLVNTVIPGRNGGPDVLAYVAKPKGEGPYPVVVMIHEFYGLNESVVGRSDGLAKEGYVVIAPDTFRGSTTAFIPRAIYQVISTKPENVDQDLDTVYSWIKADEKLSKQPIAILGFCYGGRTSLNYSLHNPNLDATVVFYGSPVTDAAILQALPGPILGIFGGSDNSIAIEDVKAFETALNTAKIPNEISIYDGQPHAFVSDMETIEAGGAAGQAWQQMLRFLEINLSKEGTTTFSPMVSDYRSFFDWKYYALLAYEHSIGTASHVH